MEDYIFNGQAHGNVAQILLQNNFDVNALRPFIGKDGRSYRNVVKNGQVKVVPVHNAPTILPKDVWLEMDTALVKVAKDRLNLVADIRSRGLTYTVPNGLGKTILEYQKMSDITDADVSMDGIREGDADRPQFSLAQLPLPIIHKDFFFTARQLEAARNGSAPLDLTNMELAVRRVAEEAEKMHAGTSTKFLDFGGANIYGLTNWPSRLTKTLTAPTGSNGNTTVLEVLQMRDSLYAENHYGPFMIYVSPSWDIFLDQDYSTAKGDNTLRDRILAIEKIAGIKTLDYLPTKTMVMLEMDKSVIRTVIGMEMTTLQWPSHGGMQQNFKVMTIMVPHLRDDYDAQIGVMHATHA